MVKYLMVITYAVLLSSTGMGQIPPQPPRPIAVYTDPLQGLVFGTLFRGTTGGTATIHPDGSRTVSGEVYEGWPGLPVSPALFELEATKGTLIHIQNGPPVILNGSNGGSITLSIGTTNPETPFITQADFPDRNTIAIGGTLSIGPPLESISGNYFGYFVVTFIQE